VKKNSRSAGEDHEETLKNQKKTQLKFITKKDKSVTDKRPEYHLGKTTFCPKVFGEKHFADFSKRD